MSSFVFSEWERILTPPTDGYDAILLDRNNEIGAFLDLDTARRRTDAPDEKAVPIAVKDNIAVSRFGLTCGSRILGDHVSPYDATIVSRLISGGFVPIGKTNLDEFGMGSSTDTSALGWIVAANPMTPIIEGYRRCIIDGASPFTARFACAAVVSVLILGAGWWTFRRQAHKFAECV